MPSTINADNGVSSGSAGLKSTADSSGVLSLQTNGTTAVTINTSQNVGIGTTSPGAFGALSVNGNVIVPNTAGLVFNTSFGNAPTTLISGSQSEDRLSFFTNTTERMRIDASGNVGIGVTPISFSTYKYLNVRGGATGTGGIFYTDTSDGSVAGQFYSSTGQVVLGSPTATPLVFQTNNAERVRIDTSGNVSSASDQYRTRYYQTGSFIPTSTKWWRLCTMPATNAGQHVEFIFTIPSVHFLMRVKFSKTTAGAFTGGGVMEVELLGSYVYWNYYPFDWRLTDGGTNLPSYLDIRFPSNAGETVAYKIQVLHSWSSDTTQHATFPVTDQGTGTTGGYYSNMGNSFSGWTKQWFRLTGSKYVYYDNNMTITSGATPPTA